MMYMLKLITRDQAKIIFLYLIRVQLVLPPLSVRPLLSLTRYALNVDPNLRFFLSPSKTRLRESSWKIMDASRTIPEIESDLLALSLEVIQNNGQKPLASLWTAMSVSDKERSDDKENLEISPNKKAKCDA